jgi:hypothetical protein
LEISEERKEKAECVHGGEFGGKGELFELGACVNDAGDDCGGEGPARGEEKVAEGCGVVEDNAVEGGFAFSGLETGCVGW